jgi:hypothetical protein
MNLIANLKLTEKSQEVRGMRNDLIFLVIMNEDIYAQEKIVPPEGGSQTPGAESFGDKGLRSHCRPPRGGVD